MLWVLIRILMSTHNIHFYGEISKISLDYHQIPTLSVQLSMYTTVKSFNMFEVFLLASHLIKTSEFAHSESKFDSMCHKTVL